MPTSDQHAGTGVSGLDDILGAGLPRNQLHLLRGTSGVGKTTLSLQFLMEGARHGETALYLGTSETEAEIRRIARSHAWSLEGVTLHHHEPYHAEAEQTVLHSAEVELPQTMTTLLSVVERFSPSRLVIDSLAEIRMLARDSFWYRQQLVMLKQHFAHGSCTVLMIETPHADQTLDSVVSGVVELTQIAGAYGPDRRRLRVIKLRGQPFSTGYHDYRIRTGGLDAFPRLVAAAHRQPVAIDRASTGLGQLDTSLHGGLTRGTSTLLLGPSGTGKSLLATQLVVTAAERGERSRFHVFDERVQTLFQRAETVGLPLQRHVDAGTIEVVQIDPAELSSGEFSDQIKRAVETEAVRLMVLDSLNGYAYAMPEERVLSVHLHELSSFLNQLGITSVFTMTQHGMLSQVTQPFDISYITDTVLLLRLFEFAGRVRKAMSVYKNRSGPHETTIRELRIGADGLSLGEPLTQFQGVLAGTPVFLGTALDDAD